MKVLFVTSEANPFAASGGLADVAAALPKALRRRLIGCRVIMPLYESIPQHLRDTMRFVGSVSVPVSWRRQYCGVFEANHDGVIYYFVDNQYYFKRAGLYGHYDDAERFAFFARAVLEAMGVVDFTPDVIHCNDWQTALVPVYLRLFYGQDERFRGVKTVYTIHNIQYQGKFGMEILGDVFGISDADRGLVEYDGCVNLMKGGIECADRVTTVSSTYAGELLDPWYAHGLDGILRERQWKLTGIVNGIDTEVYDPETDPMIFANYGVDDAQGKVANKAALQRYLNLPERPDAPLMAMVTRLVAHKGMDLVCEVLEELLQSGLQLVVLGSGECGYESFLCGLAARYPDRFQLRLGFIPDLAHKIYAGSDLFLMPSLSEPCGLSQMVALRYGAIPIVRETGGLKDTVQDSGDGVGNGFTFQRCDARDLADAVYRALAGYADRDGWAQLRARAMQCDNSWGSSANAYIRLYRDLLREK